MRGEFLPHRDNLMYQTPMPVPALSPALRSFIAVDEGLDRLVRIKPAESTTGWTFPLQTKCRTLQLLQCGDVMAVTDSGYIEVDATRGTLLREAQIFPTGVVSAQRLPNGHTFFGGLNLNNAQGVTFVQINEADCPVRTVCFGGDYVRRSTLTSADTILFTCDSRVYEGDWSGRILREYSAPGFKHAWKAIRTEDDRTIISAGYGAFVAEFADDGSVLRTWKCTDHESLVRPHFFGDFHLLPNGGLLVCNWLGHGTDLGGSGYPLLEFSPGGEIVGGWQDAASTSSLQTVIFISETPPTNLAQRQIS